MSKFGTQPAVPFAEVYGPFISMGETISDAFDDFVAAFNVSAKSAQVERRARATEKAMMALSDAALYDIGVTRGDIPAVARKCAAQSVYGRHSTIR